MFTNLAKSRCKKCDKINFVDLGDFEDLTVMDKGGYFCWYCGETNYFTEECYLIDFYGEDYADQCYIVEGSSKP